MSRKDLYEEISKLVHYCTNERAIELCISNNVDIYELVSMKEEYKKTDTKYILKCRDVIVLGMEIERRKFVNTTKQTKEMFTQMFENAFQRNYLGRNNLGENNGS